VVSQIKEVDGVIDVHHLHVWAISTSQNAMTAHVIIRATLGIEKLNTIKSNIKLELKHTNIQHVTLEFETEDENCTDTHAI
jgi:cobalt-zinc-cadmium efflux system protein